MSKVFIIAEAGVNHNGSLETAKKMVDAAKSAGADAVKFQIFNPESLASASAPQAEYQSRNIGKSGSQLEMLKKLALSNAEFTELNAYSQNKQIVFLASPFDLASIDLISSFGAEYIKVPSGEITNLPYLRKIGGLNKQVIISTGMADMQEIKDALTVLTKSGTDKDNIIVLHCNTDYPTKMEDVNLNAMLTIQSELDVTVGYSDHTLGIEVPVAAAAMGAAVIEKHFTLDKNMPGPDHKASLEPDELKAMVSAIRNIEIALGSVDKIPSPSELKNRDIVRKSIVAASNISEGEQFTEENITVKRPGTGISPMEWDNVLGQKAKRAYNKDELIEM
ncbi:MAG: N-acetylneuraminate synthase [Candidatus Margulisiibacteriota bacterium]